MRLRICVGLAGCLVASSAQLRAQVCVGTASFGAGRVRVGAGFNAGDHVKSYAAELAGGGPQGPFTSASLSTVQYDDISSSGTAFGVSGGYSIDITPAGTAQFCPQVGFAYQTGPNVTTPFGTVTSSTRAFALGGAFGGIAATSPGFDFIPFAAASYVIAQGSASLAGETSSQNQNYTDLGVGAGFVFNHTLTIQAVANIPVGLADAKPSYGLAVGFNFGKPASK